ncbi:MAG: hypothetical protein GQ564_15360 [Bacteroidales bacterium]|nr:hypothetical protein [Bacteroidales bacterium]
MNFSNYIKENFSNELNLLIRLSQNEIELESDFGVLSEINWDVFLNLVLKHRLVSHVLKHSNKLASKIPQEIIKQLKEIRLIQSKTSLEYTSVLIKIANQFRINNIKFISFKGPLLSFELYNDVGFRNFNDLDILVNKDDVENAKKIIEDLEFKCIYPKIELSDKQREINYSLSHHYHFKNKPRSIDIELHWSISNPKSFFGMPTSQIISNSQIIDISGHSISYLSTIENLVYQAAHGAIHQWYRLFWLKDFSELLKKTNPELIKKAFELSKKLKLDKCFLQAIALSYLLYNVDLPDYRDIEINKYLMKIPLKSISSTDLNQQGIKGKIKSLIYRLKLKPDLNYYFELTYRLRTHLTDWELLKLPKPLFFLFYILRPFLLIYKFLFKK